jgi:hypothetical protein
MYQSLGTSDCRDTDLGHVAQWRTNKTALTGSATKTPTKPNNCPSASKAN